MASKDKARTATPETAQGPKPLATAPTTVKRKSVKVRATADGYYGNKFRRVGDVFSISGATAAEVAQFVGAALKGDPNRLGYFSEQWMERVDEGTPDQITSNNAVLEKQRQEARSAQARGEAPGGDSPTGDADPIGDDE